MEFKVEREIDAPVESVWKAWTTPEMLEKWYSPGPINWKVDSFDCRAGGSYRMHMDTPKGEMVSEGTFHLVEAPHKLSQGPADKSMVIHTELVAKGDATRMVVRMDGVPAQQREMMQGAWNGGFDKLEKLL